MRVRDVAHLAGGACVGALIGLLWSEPNPPLALEPMTVTRVAGIDDLMWRQFDLVRQLERKQQAIDSLRLELYRCEWAR